jgi:hypothetical protein
MEPQFSFDISALEYEDFILYFFTNSRGDLWNIDPDGNEFVIPKISHPEVIVRHLTKFCVGFRELAEGLSLETLDRGINGMLSSAFFQLQRALWNDTVDIRDRIGCIRSMYRVFADFVSARKVEVLENCFYMWWDQVCTSFWFEQTYHKKLKAENYSLLSSSDKKLVDAMFETLVDILKLEDDRTKSCALHGLGHLQHPGVRKAVQDFIDLHRSNLDKDGLSWLEQCRDGTVM